MIKKLSQKQLPQSLLEIPQPPKQIYYRGALPNWNETKFITVIGSRKYTNYGKEACEKIVSELAGYNITIVSGLAIGIDSIAHKSAIESGLKTIAVPGSGLDPKNIYPSTNKLLAKKIIESGGCLLSEFEPDFKATTWSFPQRNRIMAGLADLVLVIEATEKSGTLITARMGIDYNKEIGAVPASIFSHGSKGSNNLLKQGATPITCGEDVLEILNIKKEEQEQKTINFDNFSKEERRLLKLLKEPQTREQLSEQIDAPMEEISSALTLLEIKGIIKESGGEIYIV